MKKIAVIALLLSITYHGQNFCPRGPKHPRVNARVIKRWKDESQQKREDQQRQEALHQCIKNFQNKRLKKNQRMY